LSAALVFTACSEDGTLVPRAGGDAGSALHAGPVADAGASSGQDARYRAEEAGADAPVVPGSSALDDLVVSTGALRPAFAPDVTGYDITSIDGLYPFEVTATASDPSSRLTVHGALATSGSPTTVTLQPGEDLDVTVEPSGGGAPRTYRVSYVPRDLPAWTVSAADAGAGAGPVLLSLLSTGVKTGKYLLMVDRAGRLLYYRCYPATDPELTVENFQQITLPDGSIEYAYNVGKVGAGGWTLGVDHVLDRQFHDLADYQLVPHAAHGVLPAEGHEFLLLGHGHYIAMSYVRRTVDLSQLDSAWSSQAQVMNPVVQEVQGGNVLLEWDSADVPSLYGESVDGNDFGPTEVSDYLHLNSIAIDPSDGNLLLSFRHADCIIKLDRSTGQILWTLGGVGDQFRLTSDQVFSHQHHVRPHPDGSITVFDNGNDLHQTRALRFVLDEASHTVTSFQVLTTRPASDPQSTFMGSITAREGPDGGYFIGWGGWATPQLAPAATEIDGSGNAVWSLQLSEPTFYSYRAIPVEGP
jgi:hypothetical protein